MCAGGGVGEKGREREREREKQRRVGDAAGSVWVQFHF